ncbi:MAG: Maff2 family protein [Clostridiales bacterium]|jgi:hypothetical protein|nr:Maff2 family protein [Clostridiales bacterium]
MQFFSEAISTLSVTALGAGSGVWDAINLLEGYGNDNPGTKGSIQKEATDFIGVCVVVSRVSAFSAGFSERQNTPILL